jgi:8-amino-7-oxononanoate synthase
VKILTKNIHDALSEILQKRKEASLFRSLQVNNGLIDFCSNDYLGFARSKKLAGKVKKALEGMDPLSGATGSRSISGNTLFAQDLEHLLASFHNAEAGLLFNSGYDANLGLFSCIARKDDVLITDELIHASIIDGCRLSYAGRYRFAHNSLTDLEKKLAKARQVENIATNIFVAVESVYSMDGDMAPLTEIGALCRRYNANLVVDEAHATGIFGKQGRGLVNECGMENDVFARVHTFGKAIGCHGAVVVGSKVLRDYLVNFARSFIFTTALPMHSLATIKCAYEELQSGEYSIEPLHALIRQFRNNFQLPADVFLVESRSPVQCLIIPGAERVKKIATHLQQKGFDIRAIVSPSVPAGRERLRISLHLHNTIGEIENLKQTLTQILFS